MTASKETRSAMSTEHSYGKGVICWVEIDHSHLAACQLHVLLHAIAVRGLAAPWRTYDKLAKCHPASTLSALVLSPIPCPVHLTQIEKGTWVLAKIICFCKYWPLESSPETDCTQLRFATSSSIVAPRAWQDTSYLCIFRCRYKDHRV